MKITSKDFKKYIKSEPSQFLKKKIKKLNYEILSKKEEKKYILEIVKTILEKKIHKSGKSYKEKWNSGWGQNYKEFKKTKKINSLIPKYFFKTNISRINDKLIRVKSKNFDFNVLNIITSYVFEKYFKKEKNIIEFGCGTGHNIINLRNINKTATVYGLDWSHYSQKIFEILSKKDPKIKGFFFDYFKPSIPKKEIHNIRNNFSCFTVASLEQVGSDFKKFIKFLRKENPKLIINIEPINELLHEGELLDYLSIKYSEKRNYLIGYHKYLKELERKKVIKIIEEKKSYFGSLYINGYSIIVWKFLRK
jgi:hypothetical protein